MKKEIKILLISLACLAVVLSLSYIAVHDTCGITVGMTHAEARELVPKDAFSYLDYCFYENTLGNSVVVQFSNDHKSVAKINCYPKNIFDNSRLAFSGIKKGMSVQQVVSKVGIPDGSYTSGMITLAYKLNSNSQCWIYLDSAEEGYVVQSVVFRSTK